MDLSLLMHPTSILLYAGYLYDYSLNLRLSYGWNVIPGPLGNTQDSMLFRVGEKFSLVDQNINRTSGLLIKNRSSELKDLTDFFSHLQSHLAYSPRPYSLNDIGQFILADFLETVGD